MGREIDRRSPGDRPPVNTSTVNNGNRFAGSIARSRATSSHGSFSEMAVQAVHIPGGVDRWDNDMGMTCRSNFL